MKWRKTQFFTGWGTPSVAIKKEDNYRGYLPKFCRLKRKDVCTDYIYYDFWGLRQFRGKDKVLPFSELLNFSCAKFNRINVLIKDEIKSSPVAFRKIVSVEA